MAHDITEDLTGDLTPDLTEDMSDTPQDMIPSCPPKDTWLDGAEENTHPDFGGSCTQWFDYNIMQRMRGVSVGFSRTLAYILPKTYTDTLITKIEGPNVHVQIKDFEYELSFVWRGVDLSPWLSEGQQVKLKVLDEGMKGVFTYIKTPQATLFAGGHVGPWPESGRLAFFGDELEASWSLSCGTLNDGVVHDLLITTDKEIVYMKPGQTEVFGRWIISHLENGQLGRKQEGNVISEPGFFTNMSMIRLEDQCLAQ